MEFTGKMGGITWHDECTSIGRRLDAAWQALTTAAKIASLDARLGVGIGAVRQRAKLGAK